MNFIPKDTNIYDDNQIIINSDRLIFNAKQDSILFSSNKVIGFNTNGSFHFDSEKNFIVNSNKIVLGLKRSPDGGIIYGQEPALLGNQTEEFISDLIDTIQHLMEDIETKVSFIDSSGNPTGYNSDNKIAFQTTVDMLNDLRTSFASKCKSQTVLLK
tara:strand:+ start:209 stop:679 length:471 start_codon:yes stop_codon:yes gene_type:complete